MQKMYIKRSLILLALSLFLTACPETTNCPQPISNDDPNKVELSIVPSGTSREKAELKEDAEWAQFKKDRTKFSLDFYRQLAANETQNAFFSPLSLSLAMTQVYSGARSDSEDELQNVMHFSQSQAKQHHFFNVLSSELSKRANVLDNEMCAPLEFNIASQLFGQKDLKFKAEFLDTLVKNYSSNLALMDFKNESQISRKTINNWVSWQTNARINDLLPEGSVSNATRLVLANALYFKADWDQEFNEEQSTEDDFFLDDESHKATMMHASLEDVYAADTDDYQAIIMPYNNKELEMVAIMPKNNLEAFGQFEQNLNENSMKEILGTLESTQVNLDFPKFKIDTSIGAQQIFEQLGLEKVFTEKADFSGITEEEKLYIQGIYHKAFIEVDESGTEAAAATSVVVNAETAASIALNLKFNKPFIFMIKDKETGSILFMGRVMNPSNGS